MSRYSQFFFAAVHDDESNRPFPVEVEYDYRDVGVMMRRNEKMRIVLLAVRKRKSGVDILDELDELTRQNLEDEAAGHWFNLVENSAFSNI